MKNSLRYIFSLALTAVLVATYVTADAAKPRKKAKVQQPTPAELLQKAETAFSEYRFDEALELLDQYEEKNDETPRTALLRQRADLGSTMLRRVEKIAIIDSLTVDSATVIDALLLSPTSGFVRTSDVLPEGMESARPTSVYVTENGQRMIWGANDGKGHIRLVESTLLADKSWETPHVVDEALQMDGDSNFPFLSSDGTTIYFGATGENSLGGYDIFISRNDGEDYLQPQNIGMPYNSTDNDFLMVIDEETGCGWFATDRNHIPGKLTLYVFIPQDLRVNYSAEDPDIINYSRIHSIAATQPADADYSKIRQSIQNLASHSSVAEAPEFEFTMPDGRVLHHFDDFRSQSAATQMERYLDSMAELSRLGSELSDLRLQYGQGDKSVAAQILDDEKRVDQMRAQIRRLANSIIQTEMSAQ